MILNAKTRRTPRRTKNEHRLRTHFVSKIFLKKPFELSADLFAILRAFALKSFSIMRVSFIIPVYNEAESLRELHGQILAAVNALPGNVNRERREMFETPLTSPWQEKVAAAPEGDAGEPAVPDVYQAAELRSSPPASLPSRPPPSRQRPVEADEFSSSMTVRPMRRGRKSSGCRNCTMPPRAFASAGISARRRRSRPGFKR